MQLHLRMMSAHEIACYTISEDDMDGCHVCFVSREVLAVQNATWLDGAIVCIVSVFIILMYCI